MLNDTKKGNKSKRYTDEIKRFALTLHYHSPKAYDYCRSHLHLPHPSSLRNWMSSINGEPGFQKEVFCALSKLNVEDRDCALIFDSMAIRKQVLWNSSKQKYVGYCDYGCDFSLEASDTVATEALVFMLVGLNHKWKWPIGYFFIAKVTATIQAELIKSALTLASDAGLKTWAITCDGAMVNVSTLQILGCNIQADRFESIKCSFKHPNRNYDVFAILDPCHMMKLARNTLADNKLLISDRGTIRWNLIENLHKEQTKLSLKLKNKLSSSCVMRQNNKMKVKYAVQTLSSSVANALSFLEGEGIDEFKDSAATIEYILNVDRIFDFLNTRNPFGKGFKKPVKLKDIPFLQKTMTEKINYLFTLKDNNGIYLYNGRRKTFLSGLALATKSVLWASERILKENLTLKYILTYRFSQDHVEILFSKIRNRHGFNNNPNVIQFSTAMKQILLKNAISTSIAANCMALDDDYIGSVFEIKWLNK